MTRMMAFASATVAVVVGFLGGDDKGPAPALAPAERYTMEVTGSKHFVGTWKIRVYTTDSPADEWVIHFPAAVEMSRQKNVKTTMTPPAELTKELNRDQRPVLSLHVGPTDGTTLQSIDLTVRYEATLLARKLVPVRAGTPAVPARPLDVRERALSLAATPTLDFRSEAFESWLANNGLKRGKAEGDLAFARRVYTTMLDLYTYKDGVPIQPVSQSCDLAALDCDTLSTVFAAALRANDVPARVCFAWPARTIKPDAKGVISGHAQAEFFLAGAGWVPADLAYALTAKADGKDAMKYFGEDSGNLLVAQVDPDYIVRNPAGTQRVGSMHPGPNCWSRGAKRPDVRYRPQVWEVEVKPAKPSGDERQKLDESRGRGECACETFSCTFLGRAAPLGRYRSQRGAIATYDRWSSCWNLERFLQPLP